MAEAVPSELKLTVTLDTASYKQVMAQLDAAIVKVQHLIDLAAEAGLKLGPVELPETD